MEPEKTPEVDTKKPEPGTEGADSQEPKRNTRSSLKWFFDLYLQDFERDSVNSAKAGLVIPVPEHVKFLRKLKELGYPQNVHPNEEKEAEQEAPKAE